MNPLRIRGRKSGVTEKGSDYGIVQCDNISFHITVCRGDQAIVEVFDSAPNQQFLDDQIQRLESELIDTLDIPQLTSGSI